MFTYVRTVLARFSSHVGSVPFAIDQDLWDQLLVAASKFRLSLISRPGFFQTGLTTAVECDVLLPDGTSACIGGELCVGSDPKVSNCNGAFGDLDSNHSDFG